ncbi:MAG: hypothetical protein AMS14_10880, partial [Planctomycetes bacterium DG_20]
MAVLYPIGADWNTAAHWSQSDGGGGDGWVPTASDEARFTSNSINMSLSANGVCLKLNLSAGTTAQLDLNDFNLDISSGGFTQAAGTVLAGSGQINCYGDCVITGGTFTAETSTFYFDGQATTLNASGVSFNHVKIDLAGSYVFTVSANCDIAGDFHGLNMGSISGGATITLAGDIYSDDVTFGGNVTIEFDGGTDQTIYPNLSYQMIPSVKINKGGGTLYLDDNITVGGNWERTAGTLDLQGHGVKIQRSANVTVNDGTTVFNDFTIAILGYHLTNSAVLQTSGTFKIETINQLNGSNVKCTGDIQSIDTLVGGSSTIEVCGSG